MYISQTPTPIPPIPPKLRTNLVARWQIAAVMKSAQIVYKFGGKLADGRCCGVQDLPSRSPRWQTVA